MRSMTAPWCMRTFPRCASLLLAVGVAGCQLADLRPSELARDGVTEEAEREGIERLHLAARAHGLEDWRATHASSIDFTDHWPSSVMAWFAVPWKPNSPLCLRYVRGKEAGVLSFMDGPRVGCAHVRGASGEVLVVRANGTVEQRGGDEVGEFFIPAIRYLHAFPFRILEAPIVAATGQRDFDGREFDVVFATWKSAEPNQEFDQYLVWIARDTGLVEVIECTSREEFSFSRFFTVFDQHETTQGITLPMRITILSELRPDYAEQHLHQFRIISVTHGMGLLEAEIDPLQGDAAGEVPGLARLRKLLAGTGTLQQ